MATESLAPDAYILQSNLDGTIVDIEEDPDSPDADWADAVDHGANTIAHISFPTPTAPLALFVDQEFKIWIKRSRDKGNTPECRIDLYENGVLVLIGALTTVNSLTGELKTFLWDAINLTNADGSGVECYVFGDASGGNPANRETVSVGAIEWNVDYTEAGIQKALAASTTPSAAIGRTVTSLKTLVATTTPGAGLGRAITRGLVATTTPQAQIGRTTYRALLATTTLLGLVDRGFWMPKALAATTTPSAAISRAIKFVKSLAATTIPQAAVTRKISRALVATTTPIALIARSATGLVAARVKNMLLWW